MQGTNAVSLWQRSITALQSPSALVQRTGWTTGGYIASQVIRFGTNLILTRILAPELFGIMVLLTSLRVGMELFTDIGISQNVIASPNANDPRFYNTAWTLQLLRGLLLALLSLALMPILARFYDEDQLATVLPFISLFFIMAGFQSIGLPLAVKALNTKRTAMYEAGGATLGAVVMIVSAVLSPTIWGLLVGNLLATLVTVLLSYFTMAGLAYRITIDRTYFWEIFGLGKWVFLSSIVFFLATNFDRLALAKFVSFALLGVYGLARSLADVLGQLSAKLGGYIIFPTVASAGVVGEELRQRLGPRRFQFLLLATVATAILFALAAPLISFLYDDRYKMAADVLPWLALATWVGTVGATNESVLLGLRKPMYMAAANAAKCVALIVLLPSAVISYGIVGAAIATIAAETSRYIALSIGQYREKCSFLRQDALLLSLLVLMAFGLAGIVSAFGWQTIWSKAAAFAV